MTSTIFNKTSTGVNPLESARDWAILGGIAAFTLAVFNLLALWLPPDMVRMIMIGSLSGSLPPLLMCVAVKGTIPAPARQAFMTSVAESGFVPAGVVNGVRRFNYKTPHWARWDSNRILLDDSGSDDWHATVPLYFYLQLKKREK